MVKDQAKWTDMYDAYIQLDHDMRETVANFYVEALRKSYEASEVVMERALKAYGCLPAIVNLGDYAAQEYDDIQHGEEIWASIQRSSGN